MTGRSGDIDVHFLSDTAVAVCFAVAVDRPLQRAFVDILNLMVAEDVRSGVGA